MDETASHGVTYLKFSACILVFIYHTLLIATNFNPNVIFESSPIAFASVGIFFYASGYLAPNSRLADQPKKYVLSKFLKLYPLYVIAVLISVPYVADVQRGQMILYPFLGQIFSPSPSGFLWFVPVIFARICLLACTRKTNFVPLTAFCCLSGYLAYLTCVVNFQNTGLASIAYLTLFFAGAKTQKMIHFPKNPLKLLVS